MKTEIVVIGASMGGVQAIRAILSGLPLEFRLPVVVAQHRSREMELREYLGAALPLPVLEAENGAPILPGHTYVAPADYHLFIERGSLALSLDPPVHHARPSVDVLFQSAADAYGPTVVGIILSGRGTDGAKGLAAISQAGGLALVQDPLTAEEKAMPQAALLATKNAETLSIFAIGSRLCQLSSLAQVDGSAQEPR